LAFLNVLLVLGLAAGLMAMAALDVAAALVPTAPLIPAALVPATLMSAVLMPTALTMPALVVVIGVRLRPCVVMLASASFLGHLNY
jgi:hypothetical protein